VRRRATAGVLVVLLTGAVLVAAAGAVLAQPGERIRTFDVDITVTPSGELEVVEEIAYDFGTNSRRGIFRVVPVRYALPAAVSFDLPDPDASPEEYLRALDLTAIRVEVLSDASGETRIERPGPIASAGDTVSIRIGEEDRFFSGLHTYRISYRVRGALNGFGGAPPELAWNATGDGWPVPMDEVTVTVRGPGVSRALCLVGSLGATSECTSGGIDGEVARYSATKVPPGSGVTVVAGFAPAGVQVPDPILVPRWSLSRAFTGSRWAVPLTVLTALVGIGGVLVLAFRQGRDRVTTGGTNVHGMATGVPEAERRRGLFEPHPVAVRYRPPEGLRPGQLGLVVDERVDAVDVSATVVDLAVRGHLRIEEQESKVLWFSRTDWRLVATPERVEPDDPELRRYERYLLDGFFADGDEVLLSDLKGTFHETYGKAVRALYEEGRLRRWFNGRPDKVRARWVGIGVALLVAAVGALVAAVVFTTVALALVPLVVAGVALLVASGSMPHRTAKGSALLVETLGFREFVVTAETGRMELAEAERLFVTMLPYAVVFGAVDRWAKRFAALGVVTGSAVGGWWVGAHACDAAGFSSSMTSLSSTLGTAMATSPSSTSGGGGFSGGAGGGFGGGGGGSW
jgi:hypothetical protein